MKNNLLAATLLLYTIIFCTRKGTNASSKDSIKSQNEAAVTLKMLL
jgi:hypothetical protein